MELEQYLERDIITFLDSKMDKDEKNVIDREEDYGLYLTRDYLKDISYALDNDELTKAKKLFDELKINYSRLPKNSVERKKIYSILEKMYEKIQNYVKIKEGKIEIIRQGDSEIFKDKTDKFTELNTGSPTVEESKPEVSMPVKQQPDNTVRPQKHKNVEEDKIFVTSKGKIINSKSSTTPIESNITESSIKNSKKDNIKYYDEKTESEKEGDISSLNVFVKSKSETPIFNQSSSNITEKENKHLMRNEYREHSFKEIPRTPRYSEEKSLDLEHLKNDIINKTVEQVEKLKTHITEKLLDEIKKKLEEENNIQNQKIEQLKQEIVAQAMNEIRKKIDQEKRSETHKIDLIKNEILSEVFEKAQTMIAINDKQHNADPNNRVVVEHYRIESPTLNIPALDRSDIIRFTKPLKAEEHNKKENTSDIKNNLIDINKYSDNQLQIVYEQAVYHMFNDKYEDAAKLFRKIINLQPNNKAARIRLQECLDKEPELMNNTEVADDKIIQPLIKIQKTAHHKDPVIKEYDVEDFKSDMTEHAHKMTKKIEEIHKNRLRHKYSDEEIQKLYEEAIYTMFQNNYGEAKELFEKLLEIRPENRAAKIRLQECLEAMSNA
jgi:thioredoxin-like negative regulator of GroEL